MGHRGYVFAQMYVGHGVRHTYPLAEPLEIYINPCTERAK